MPRPTNDPKTRVIKVRINEEMATALERMGENFSDTVRNLINIGLKTGIDGYVPHENPVDSVSVPQNDPDIDPGVKDDIKNMLAFMDTDLNRFMRAIDNTLTAGELEIVGDKVKTINQDVSVEPFLEACHDLNIEPQKAMEKMVQTLYRSR